MNEFKFNLPTRKITIIAPEEWVCCQEGFPQTNERVLVFVMNAKGDTNLRLGYLDHQEKWITGNFESDMVIGQDQRVIFWRPLPDSPIICSGEEEK